jgi:hypothetical protein
VLSDRAVTFIACAVTVAWIGLSFIDAASKSYSTPTEVHAIMGLVAGALFGERAVRRQAKK